MAGRVVVSTLNNDTGSLATQNGMTGICKAWVQFRASTAVIAGSFNVSSVTTNGSGDWTITYTSAMPNTSYAVALGAATQGAQVDGRQSGMAVYGSSGINTGSVRVASFNMVSGAGDSSAPYLSVAVFSS
jgi:regulation of enolase protein 1 (concanavalin A-like superfamily)